MSTHSREAESAARGGSSRRLVRAAFAAGTSLFVGLGFAACGANPKPAVSSASRVQRGHAQAITFGLTTCAPNWRVHAAGTTSFLIENGSPKSATVYLFRSASGAIVATLSRIKPYSSEPLRVALAAGSSYSWGCDLNGYPDHVSDSETAPIDGLVAGPRVVPVYVGDLVPALDGYRRYVKRVFTRLQRQVGQLLSSTRPGELARARSDWLMAHRSWLDLGQDDGAYGAFGNLGQEIDGTAAGVVGGRASPGFTGFHRIEDDLWRERDLEAAQLDTRTLQRLVSLLVHRNLETEFPATKAGMTNFTIRCHEVLEDALRDSLSADDDYGSGSDLASLLSDVSATRKLLTLFAPVIDPRAPDLVLAARRQLNTVTRTIRATKRAGRWLAINSLPQSQRVRVDASVGAALQTLSRLPDLLAIGGA